MNREIKFRGQKVDTKEWVYGVPLDNGNGVVRIIHLSSEDSLTFIFTEVIPETIGQLVGLNDKNNNPIYEGDIIKSWFGEWNDVIIWDSRYAQFTAGGGEFGCELHPDKVEVIGNIFESPEILNQNKEK